MGWSGSITSSTPVNSSITLTSDTSIRGAYTVSQFTPGKAGIYKFQLYGSGGFDTAKLNPEGTHTIVNSLGGNGGYVEYYLLMTSTQNTSVYVGVGGPCSAAFISNKSGSSLREIMNGRAEPMYAIAGGGGGSSVINCDDWNGTGYNSYVHNGGAGGGASGENSYGGKYVAAGDGGSGGTASGIGTQGSVKGGVGYGGEQPDQLWGGGFGGLVGRGGDGLFGGNAGQGSLTDWGSGHGAEVTGGGGGASFIGTGFGYTFSYNGQTFTNSTTTGGGMGSDQNGKIVITLIMEANGTPTPPTSLWLNKTTADTLEETCYLSWNGASAGYLNRITGYNIYLNGALYQTISTSNTSYSNYQVKAPNSPNGSHTYTVATNVISTQDNTTTKTSAQSSSVVLQTTSRSEPTAPNTILINNANPCYIGNSGLSTLTLTWSGARPGIYNNISGYNIYKNGKFYATTTATSYNLLPQTDPSGTYTIYTLGSAGTNSAVSKGATVEYIAQPLAPVMKLFVPEVTARDIPLKWDAISAPIGSSVTYSIRYQLNGGITTEIIETSQTSYTFPISKIAVGKKFNIYVYTVAKASGNSYTLSPVTTINTGRVGVFNLPTSYSTFWKGIYDPASTLSGRQGHAYQSVTLIWAPATPAEASGTIYTYTLKCKVGSSAWNDIYTITKAPGDSDYSDNLTYSYSLANISSNTQVSFYVLVKDNYNTEVSTSEAAVIKLATPTLTDVTINNSYRKTALGFCALPTTNGLTDTLVYTVYFSHQEKEAQYGQGNVTNTSGIVSGLTYELKVEDGKNANTNTFLGALYESVITNKYPYPSGAVKIKIHYKSYPNCYIINTYNTTYNFLHEITSPPEITYIMPSEHSTYCNPLDEVSYSFTPIGWTDAAGETNGATITYTMTANEIVGLTNPQSPNTKYITTMPSSFLVDNVITYTLTTRIAYADGNTRTNTTSISFNVARWYPGDVLKINSPRQIAGTVTGNYALPENLWRSSKYDNLTKIVLEVYNSDKSQSYAASKATVTTFTSSNLLIPFSFDGVDEGTDLVVCARAVCTNTSGRSITIFSSYYVIRSSAVTIALRKGALGLNVGNDFNPTDTESTLYINAKPKGASPTIVVNEDAEQPNNGRSMQFIKGTIDYGGLDIRNDSIIGRGMSKIIRGSLLLGNTIQDITIYINNDDNSFKNDCPITFSLDYPNMSEAQARAARHLRITNMAHEIANNRITITYRCNKILQHTAYIPFMVQMMSLTAK